MNPIVFTAFIIMWVRYRDRLYSLIFICDYVWSSCFTIRLEFFYCSCREWTMWGSEFCCDHREMSSSVAIHFPWLYPHRSLPVLPSYEASIDPWWGVGLHHTLPATRWGSSVMSCGFWQSLWEFSYIWINIGLVEVVIPPFGGRACSFFLVPNICNWRSTICSV